MNLTGLVSIIMPSYNHARYIGEAINSVLAQTYSNWELLIVDNHSIDETFGIINKIKDDRIKLLMVNNDGIIAKSRNIGIQNAKGDFIAFLDSDDVWCPEKLALQLDVFNKYSNVALVCGLMRLIPSGRNVRLSTKNENIVQFQELLGDNKIGNSGAIIRADIIPKVGYIDEDREILGVEDYSYWLKILSYGYDAFILNSVVFLYRIHVNQVTTSKSILMSHKKIIKVLSKYSHCKGYRTAFFKQLRRELKLVIIRSVKQIYLSIYTKSIC